MSGKALDAAEIKGLGWRQGSVLPEALVRSLREQELLPQATESGELWIVASHSCDVTSESFVKEPLVELLHLTRLEAPQFDGARAWFKNPRVCHFREAADGVNVAWEIRIDEKKTIRRDTLLGQHPDTARALKRETIQRIALWLARRYTRAAFPDEFNRRCVQAGDCLKRDLKSRGQLLTGIYLHVDDRELDEGSAYEIVIVGSMRDEEHQVPQTRADAQELLNDIEVAFDECDGIEVRKSALKSEAEVTLDDLRDLKRWDWDYLSLRDESVTGIPPTG